MVFHHYYFNPTVFLHQKNLEKERDVKKALRERDSTLESIFKLAPMGIGMVCDRVFTQVNQKFYDMLGYPDQFDIVVTDLTMPNLTGDKLAAEINRIRSNLPVIIATGFSERLDDMNIAALGIKKVVLKSMLMRDIGEAIIAVLDEKA